MNKAAIVALNLTLVACNISLICSRRKGGRNTVANIISTVAIVAGVIAIAASLLD